MDVSVREAGPEELSDAPTFLQSRFWGRFKAKAGWKASHFMVQAEGAVVDGVAQRLESGLLVMERSLGAGLGFAYVPDGPAIDLDAASRNAFLSDLAAALKPRLSRQDLFLRFDPPWFEAESRASGSEAEVDEDPPAQAGVPGGPGRIVPRPSFGKPLRRAAADVQPPDTVLLDLSQDESAILEGMKPKWRYNIRLGEKKGVLVSEARLDGEWRPALSAFYGLYRETSERDRIALHPESYYRGLFELAETEEHRQSASFPDLRIWTASHEGDALAAIITIFWGAKAVYLYGASSNEKRNLMPSYALQWAAIRAAKAAGCEEYDFYGIPPTDDPEHPMAGLYRFKTGFGGRIVHRGGSWDYPLRPLAYAAFRAAESARTWYYKDFRKRR